MPTTYQGHDMTDMTALAATIQAFEFDHVFTLNTDGTITEPAGVYAPSVYHDPDGDVTIDAWPAGTRWTCMTGLTGQDSYHGAVMHASEFVGRGVAQAMFDLTEDGPVTFALVVVYCLPDEDEPDADDDVAGWAIAYRRD